MPSGQKHVWINCLLLFIVNCIIIVSTSINEVGLLCIFINLFLFSTFYIGPDLDTDSSIYHRWGILKIIWWPYKKLCNHRQRSHGFIWGPVSILLNILLLLSPVIYILYQNDYQFPWTEMLYVTAGIVFSIESHIVADRLL